MRLPRREAVETPKAIGLLMVRAAREALAIAMPARVAYQVREVAVVVAERVVQLTECPVAGGDRERVCHEVIEAHALVALVEALGGGGAARDEQVASGRADGMTVLRVLGQHLRVRVRVG